MQASQNAVEREHCAALSKWTYPTDQSGGHLFDCLFVLNFVAWRELKRQYFLSGHWWLQDVCFNYFWLAMLGSKYFWAGCKYLFLTLINWKWNFIFYFGVKGGGGRLLATVAGNSGPCQGRFRDVGSCQCITLYHMPCSWSLPPSLSCCSSLGA